MTSNFVDDVKFWLLRFTLRCLFRVLKLRFDNISPSVEKRIDSSNWSQVIAITSNLAETKNEP